MSLPFIPLFSQEHAKTAANISGANRAAFHPALMPDGSSATEAAASNAKAAVDSKCRPTVTLERDGDCVRQIRIRCSCGDVIELDCSY